MRVRQMHKPRTSERYSLEKKIYLDRTLTRAKKAYVQGENKPEPESMRTTRILGESRREVPSPARGKKAPTEVAT